VVELVAQPRQTRVFTELARDLLDRALHRL
jgi:hypothetical protein